MGSHTPHIPKLENAKEHRFFSFFRLSPIPARTQGLKKTKQNKKKRLLSEEKKKIHKRKKAAVTKTSLGVCRPSCSPQNGAEPARDSLQVTTFKTQHYQSPEHTVLTLQLL